MPDSCVIDAYASLGLGFPGYAARCDPPPLKPFQAEREGPPRKKRKTVSLSVADADSRAHHEAIAPWLGEAVSQARGAHIAHPASSGWSSASEGSYVSVEPTQEGVRLSELAREATPRASVLPCPDQADDDELARWVYTNGADGLRHLRVSTGAAFVIPPRSAFLLARLDQWQEPLEAMARRTAGIDLVLLDPPWPNKSASRSASYETFDVYDLFGLDLPSIVEESCPSKPVLVGVWLTNRPKYRRFVLDKLFPAWSILPAAENWYWVKVTGGELAEGGRPVWPLSNDHRRCYEPLVLGWYRPRGHPDLPLPDLPDRHAFLSVPLGHSRKPSVLDLLRPYLGTKPPTVLELFARTVTSGLVAPAWYIAAGDEVLHYNDVDRYWVADTAEEDGGGGGGAAAGRSDGAA